MICVTGPTTFWNEGHVGSTRTNILHLSSPQAHNF